MTDRLFPDGRICATLPAMTLLTKQERWVLLAFLALVITGLLGKAWLAARKLWHQELRAKLAHGTAKQRGITEPLIHSIPGAISPVDADLPSYPHTFQRISTTRSTT